VTTSKSDWPGDSGTPRDEAIDEMTRSAEDTSSSATITTPSNSAAGGLAARSVSAQLQDQPLAEQHCEIVRDQRAELIAGGETAIGQSVRLDAAEHFLEPRITVRGWGLNVNELRHATGVQVLVLQPGNLLVGRDPPILLPVDPDEDVALPQVGEVEISRGIWTGAQLEQHRDQPESFDGAARGRSCASQLLHRRADEDAQPLVWRSDSRHAGLPSTGRSA
jgi:hypothetical protein